MRSTPLGGIPPGAPFLSRQERGKECGLREALTGCFLSIFLQKQENRPRRDPAEMRAALSFKAESKKKDCISGGGML